MSYKFLKFILPIMILLPSCKKESEKKVPLYHIEGINFQLDKKYYHLLYSVDKDVLSLLINKKASFSLSIYSESCSNTCSIFDMSLYSIANDNNTFIPYMDKSIYDEINDLNLPTIKENAILFFDQGKLFKQIDVTEDNVNVEEVKTIFNTYTYDTDLKIINSFYKNDEDKLINSFKFSSYDLSNENIIFPSISKEEKTLFLNLEKESSLFDIQNTYSNNDTIQNIYLYDGIDSLTSDFYSSFNIKKEELELNSSYII